MALATLHRAAGPDLILFIHGLGCVKESFAGAWKAPGLERFSLLAPDLPGHGATGADEGGGRGGRMEDHAAALEGLLGAYSYERLHIVGHSMGGAPGLMLAQGGVPGLASFMSVEGNLVAEDCSLVSRRAAGVNRETFVAEKFAKMLAAAAKSADADARMWTAWAERCDPALFHAAGVSLVEWSDSERLLEIFRALDVPKLYVHGERTGIPAVLDRIPDQPQVCLPGLGHFPMTEDARTFHDVLADHLRPFMALAGGGPGRDGGPLNRAAR